MTVIESSLIVCVVWTVVDRASAEAVIEASTTDVATSPTMIAEIPKSLFPRIKVKLLGASMGTGQI